MVDAMLLKTNRLQPQKNSFQQSHLDLDELKEYHTQSYQVQNSHQVEQNGTISPNYVTLDHEGKDLKKELIQIHVNNHNKEELKEGSNSMMDMYHERDTRNILPSGGRGTGYTHIRIHNENSIRDSLSKRSG